MIAGEKLAQAVGAGIDEEYANELRGTVAGIASKLVGDDAEDWLAGGTPAFWYAMQSSMTRWGS